MREASLSLSPHTRDFGHRLYFVHTPTTTTYYRLFSRAALPPVYCCATCSCLRPTSKIQNPPTPTEVLPPNDCPHPARQRTTSFELMPASLAISGNHAPEHTMDSRRVTPSSSPQTKSHGNKQSWDYILRSGLAGGIAGCAVRHFRSHIFALYSHTT